MKTNKMKIFACLVLILFLFLPAQVFSMEGNEDGSAHFNQDINELDISSGSWKVDLKNSTASFIGDVKVIADNMEMSCQQLTVFLKKPQKDTASNNTQPSIDKFHATGSIRITIPDVGNAASEEAVYERSSRQIVLTGNPVGKFMMNDQLVEIPGGVEKITYDLGEETIFVESSQTEQAELSISGKDKR